MNVTTHPSPPKISLLHATRGRPVQAVECRERWFRLAKSPESVEHLFAVDWDDAPSLQGLAAFSPLVVNDRDGGCVAAWNLVASHSTGEILVQLSDDWVPPQDWDQLIRQAVGDSVPPAMQKLNLQAFDKGFEYGAELVHRLAENGDAEQIPLLETEA